MTIKVVLIRHALANTQPLRGSTSEISDVGRAIQHQMDGYMLEIGLIPTEIWHSPILRAKHTAEVIAKDFNVPLKEELSLGDNFDEIDLVEKFSEAQAGSCIFLVSHGPQLMRLSTYLLGRSIFKTQIPTSSALVIEFQKQVGEGKGIFVKIVQPEMVLRLKGKPI